MSKVKICLNLLNIEDDLLKNVIFIKQNEKVTLEFETDSNLDIDILMQPKSDGIFVFGLKDNIAKNNKFIKNPYKPKISCERCSNYFNNEDLEMHNGELLCDDCIDEVINEQGKVSDV